MRIIAGLCRGLKLDSLDGLSTRPTLDRVKEAVFSSIAPYLPGAYVLDLFAGSGALGLEALSRGAAQATFVDESPAAIAVVRKNVCKARMEGKSRLVRCSWQAFVSGYTGEGFDLVFLDPPYKLWEGSGLLDSLLSGGLLKPGALVAAESAQDMLPCAKQLQMEKHRRYGATAMTYWRAP